MFRHYSEPFTPDNKDIVTPNNDTPYSWAWLDLRAEPMVVSVPAVPKDRYYVMQWIDLFTQNFAYIGVRSTGFDAGSYMIAGPKWNGKKPEGIKQVFKAETDIVGTLTRTALQGPEDVANVKAIQAQYKLQPLSTFLKQPAPPPAPAIDFPPYDKAKASTHDFIGYLNFLLQFAEPPDPKRGRDPQALREDRHWAGQAVGRLQSRSGHARGDRCRREGGTGGNRRAGGQDLQHQRAVRLARPVEDQLSATRRRSDERPLRQFARRGLVRRLCLRRQQAVGLHFTKANLPPAKFFWSMTMYTIPDRFLYANPLNRYSIGDRTKGLEYDKDGGLTIYVSNASPGKDKESNWLPAPAAKCSLVARVYGPSKAAMMGSGNCRHCSHLWRRRTPNRLPPPQPQ